MKTNQYAIVKVDGISQAPKGTIIKIVDVYPNSVKATAVGNFILWTTKTFGISQILTTDSTPLDDNEATLIAKLSGYLLDRADMKIDTPLMGPKVTEGMIGDVHYKVADMPRRTDPPSSKDGFTVIGDDPAIEVYAVAGTWGEGDFAFPQSQTTSETPSLSSSSRPSRTMRLTGVKGPLYIVKANVTAFGRDPESQYTELWTTDGCTRWTDVKESPEEIDKLINE